MAGDEEADETDRPGSDDGDPLTALQPDVLPGVHGVGERLHEGRRLPGHALGQVVHGGRGHRHPVGEAAGPVHTHELADAAQLRGRHAGTGRSDPQLTSGFTTTRRPSGVSPVNSCPMISGGLRKPTLRKPCSSLPQIPAARTDSTSSPGRRLGRRHLLELDRPRAR